MFSDLEELEELLPSYLALRAMDSSMMDDQVGRTDFETNDANETERRLEQQEQNHQRRLSRLKGFVPMSLQQQSPQLARHTKHHNPYDPALLLLGPGR